MSHITLSKDFERCHPVTAAWEGGWANDPDDPGGKTMYGVTHAVYDAYRDKKGLKRRPVREITRDEALDIFYTGYWRAANCEPLWPGVDLAVYDAAVNSGPGRARKWLIASVGSSDHSVTVKRICGKRLGFVQSLKTFWKFGKGWTRRIADVQAKGVAWALAAMHGPVVAGGMVADEASAKDKTAKTQTKAGSTAGATTGAGAGDIVLNPDHVQQAGGEWFVAGLIIAGVLVAGVLIFKAVVNRQQAKAYEKEAKALNA